MIMAPKIGRLKLTSASFCILINDRDGVARNEASRFRHNGDARLQTLDDLHASTVTTACSDANLERLSLIHRENLFNTGETRDRRRRHENHGLLLRRDDLRAR